MGYSPKYRKYQNQEMASSLPSESEKESQAASSSGANNGSFDEFYSEVNYFCLYIYIFGVVSVLVVKFSIYSER